MSIATELQDLNDNIKAAYNKVGALGGEVPANKNMVNLPDAMETIREFDIHMTTRGSSPVVYERGEPLARTVDESFVPSDVTVIGARAMLCAYGNLLQDGSSERRGTNFENITKIEHSGLRYAFCQLPTDGYMLFRGAIKDINFDSLTEVGNYGLANTYSYNMVENISFPELTTVGGYAFAETFSDSSAVDAVASFPKVNSVSYYAFQKTFASPNTSGYPNAGLASVDFSGLEEIDRSSSNAFSYTFDNNKRLASADFSSLRAIDASNAFDHTFYRCTALTSVPFTALEEITHTSSTTSGAELSYCFSESGVQTANFPELTTVDSNWTGALTYAFSKCASLTSADFPKLTYASNSCFNYCFYQDTALSSFNAPLLQKVGSSAFSYAFYGCTALTTVTLTSLEEFNSSAIRVFENAFRGCTSLANVSFPSLAVIPDNNSNTNFNNAFNGCTSLTSVSFPALTANSFGTNRSHFSGMLTGTSGVTLHFAAAAQSVIQSMDGYPNFGGTNTTVLFDL